MLLSNQLHCYSTVHALIFVLSLSLSLPLSLLAVPELRPVRVGGGGGLVYSLSFAPDEEAAALVLFLSPAAQNQRVLPVRGPR